jgi:hypothetical protein
MPAMRLTAEAGVGPAQLLRSSDGTWEEGPNLSLKEVRVAAGNMAVARGFEELVE